ncbi:MAG: xanthine dehydrogenase family protein molybdopterin-binding subunit [Candidatus Neomarinimicrobiota bacterium]
MDKQYQYIGRAFPSIDAGAKTTGSTRYLTDMSVDRMVWGYPVFSTIPFGRIRGINQKRARAVPGCVELLFAGEIPGENQVGVIIDDQPLLADDVVRFIGDVIGVAVADTLEAAIKMASLVDVEYDEYEPIWSIDDSKTATENWIHESNVACRHQVVRGDLSTGFAEADLIVEADFHTPVQEHYYLEPQGCIAIPETGDHITVMGSMQCPFYAQNAVAKALGIPLSHVRVTQAPTGGAFGGKEDIPSELAARAAVAARKVDRPVKMVYRRRDDIQLTSKRHPFQMHYKVGVTNNGKLCAADINLESSAGAYATLSSVVSYRSTMQAMGPYVIPNIRVRSTSYYTNLPPNGAFRGFGSPQATFGHERIMDLIAARLGMDPIEFRLQNLVHTGAATLTGHTLTTSVGAEETLLKARKASRWQKERTSKPSSDRYRTGIGVAMSHYGNCLGAAGWALDGAGVKIQIRRDGSIAVAYGLTDMGQGATSVVVQMTAEALGVNHERITVVPTDTQNVPDSGPSVASRNVVMTGNAIQDAASKLLPMLKSAAAELLECSIEDIIIGQDVARDRSTANSINFTNLAEHLFMTNRPMDMTGWWHVPPLDFDPETGCGEAYFTYSYATHIAHVIVDTLTGLIEVDRIWAAHDVGKVINPADLYGQVEGGTAQGIGWALTEQFRYDSGRAITNNLSTYLLPTIRDVARVETIPVEASEPLGPWGAKGVGEPAIIPTGAAIANAVSHALDTPINSIPITPETVLRILQDHAENNSGTRKT